MFNCFATILYFLHDWSRKVKTKLFSFIISKKLCKCGKNTTILPLASLRGAEHIVIGENSRIGMYGFLTAWDYISDSLFSPSIVIGDNVSIGDCFHITAINNITICDGVLIGKFVTITDNSHGYTDMTSLHTRPTKRIPYSKGSVLIEKDVWVGDKATILPGVKIGTGSVVACGAVVTKDIPPYVIVGGVPAKKIGERKQDLSYSLNYRPFFD